MIVRKPSNVAFDLKNAHPTRIRTKYAFIEYILRFRKWGVQLEVAVAVAVGASDNVAPLVWQRRLRGRGHVNAGSRVVFGVVFGHGPTLRFSFLKAEEALDRDKFMLVYTY